MIEWILQVTSGIPSEIVTVILASFPIGELRASIPVAITVFEMNALSAFAYSYIGNLIPIVFIFAVLPPIMKITTKRSKWFNNLIEKYFHHLEHKHKNKFNRYGRVAILLFVAIPLPGSGVWTASILSILFGVEKSYSIPAIMIGLGIAGFIVLLITQGALGVLSFLL